MTKEAYAPRSKKKSTEINALWLEHQYDQNPDDIMLPPELEEPEVPQVDDNELGCACRRQFQNILSNSHEFDNDQLD